MTTIDDPNRARALAAAFDRVRARIALAERHAGRASEAVALVAVSKTMPASDVALSLGAGQRDFGENYAQELRDKRAELTSHAPAPRWHFIGPLQSNKVKYVAGLCALVHTVDSPELLDDINRRVPVGVVQDCLVQVNVAGEAQKRGVSPALLPALLDHFATAERTRCVGLMLIPPHSDDPNGARPHFAELRRLRDFEARTPRSHVDLRELSMGMSQDLEAAITEGATLVRVGTALFGERRP